MRVTKVYYSCLWGRKREISVRPFPSASVALNWIALPTDPSARGRVEVNFGSVWVPSSLKSCLWGHLQRLLSHSLMRHLCNFPWTSVTNRLSSQCRTKNTSDNEAHIDGWGEQPTSTAYMSTHIKSSPILRNCSDHLWATHKDSFAIEWEVLRFDWRSSAGLAHTGSTESVLLYSLSRAVNRPMEHSDATYEVLITDVYLAALHNSFLPNQFIWQLMNMAL